MGELLFSETFHGINQLGRQQQQDQSMPLNQIHLSDLAMSRGKEPLFNLKPIFAVFIISAWVEVEQSNYESQF